MKSWFKIFKNKKVVIWLLILLASLLAAWAVYSRNTQVLPDAAIHFLNDARTPKADQSVLVFSPHPDDETIGAGGYVYDAVKAGARVYIVLVTDGNKHHLKDKRYEEFKKATSILGVPESNLTFLNYPDGRLKKVDVNEVYSSFKKEVDRIKPDFVLFTHAQDTHPDHAQTGIIAEKVLSDEHYSGIEYRYLIHHPHFPQPKKYDSSRNLMPPISLISFDKEWLRFDLDNETIDQKTRAIFTYKTQLGVPFLRSLILSSIRKNELFSIDRGGVN